MENMVITWTGRVKLMTNIRCVQKFPTPLFLKINKTRRLNIAPFQFGKDSNRRKEYK